MENAEQARQVQSALQRRKGARIYFVIISYSFMVGHEMQTDLWISQQTSQRETYYFNTTASFPVSHFFPSFKGHC